MGGGLSNPAPDPMSSVSNWDIRVPLVNWCNWLEVRVSISNNLFISSKQPLHRQSVRLRLGLAPDLSSVGFGKKMASVAIESQARPGR
jgi:hypothetical protein